MNLKESTLNKADVKTALNNALKNGEEFDIPFKYSDDWEFTDELDNYLDKQGYEFVGSFRDKKYGSLYEYSDGFESIYLMMDTSLSSRAIVTGIISNKVYNENKKSARKSINEGIQKKDWKDWKIDAFELGTYFFNGNKVNERDVQNLINEDYDNVSVNYVEINKLLDKMFVGKTLGDLANQEYAMIFGKDVDLALWFDLTLEELKSVQDNGKYGFVTVHATFSIPSTTEIYNFGLSGYVGVNIEYGSMFLENKKSARKSMKESMDTSVVGTNKDKTKKYAYDFLKEWYDKIVVESLINDDGDYVLKVGFYDDTLKKRPDVMNIVSAKLSGNSKFLQMLDNDTVCKLVVYDVNNPRKYGVYWL